MIAGKIYAGKLLDDLKDIVKDLPGAIDQGEENYAAAIAVAAQRRAGSLGGVHSYVRSGIESRDSEIVLDGTRFPMIFGAEFGGGGRPRTRQFPPHRGSGSGAGYMLYPEIREHDDEFDEIFGEPIDEVLD